MGRDTKDEVWEGFKKKLPLLLGTHRPPGTHIWQYSKNIAKQGTTAELCPEFFLKLHPRGMLG